MALPKSIQLHGCSMLAPYFLWRKHGVTMEKIQRNIKRVFSEEYLVQYEINLFV